MCAAPVFADANCVFACLRPLRLVTLIVCLCVRSPRFADANRVCVCAAPGRAPVLGVSLEHPAGVPVAERPQHGAVHPRIHCQRHRRRTPAADGRDQAKGEGLVGRSSLHV